MPLFHFLKDDQAVKLDDVEADFLKRFGQEPEYIRFLGSRSAQFEILCLNGITCTRRGSFSQEAFDQLYTNSDAYTSEQKIVCLDFLNGTYHFQSWRS